MLHLSLASIDFTGFYHAFATMMRVYMSGSGVNTGG